MQKALKIMGSSDPDPYFISIDGCDFYICHLLALACILQSFLNRIGVWQWARALIELFKVLSPWKITSVVTNILDSDMAC